MKKTTYTCDLCRTERDTDQLHGVMFTASGFEFRTAHDCNTHIGTTCVATIAAIARREKWD